jgi:Rrf2 family iron-sulfur cluster assembly transcriptional regulator
MLSTRTRYSIIALCDIARGRNARPVSLVEIAEERGLPLCYLEQIAVRWRKAGFVKGVRGPQGGYVLKKKPQDITIADIARAMEEVACAGDCDDAEKARLAGCPAQRVIDLISEQMMRALAGLTLADLLATDDMTEGLDKGLRPRPAASAERPVA